MEEPGGDELDGWVWIMVMEWQEERAGRELRDMHARKINVSVGGTLPP